MKFCQSTLTRYIITLGIISSSSYTQAFSPVYSSSLTSSLKYTLINGQVRTSSKFSHVPLHMSSSTEASPSTINVMDPLEAIQEQETQLLNAINEYKNSKSDSEKPPEEAFLDLIEKWLAFPQPQKAEAILDKMEEEYTPSGRIYERIINAWSFAAVEMINQILSVEREIKSNIDESDPEYEKKMEKFEKEKLKVRNESISYSSRAVSLLSRMEQLYQEIEGDDFRPALSTYTSVINSITRSTNSIFVKGVENGEDGGKEDGGKEDGLNLLELTSQKDTIERIRKRRDEIYNYDSNMANNRIPIESVQDVFAVLKSLNDESVLEAVKRDPHGSPITNRANFNIIINALAQKGETWAAQTAEDILDFMILQCEIKDSVVGEKSDGTKEVKMESKSLVDDEEFDTEKVRKRHRQVTPDLESINACINAWAQCTNESKATSRAEAILEKLNVLQTQKAILTNVTPDSVSYNTIIKAYANKADAERAEAILNTMIELHQSTADKKIKPDLISYSSVLNAYARSARHDPNASKKSEEILMQMVKMQEEEEGKGGKERLVNTWCFNTVLNAYAVQGKGGNASNLLKEMETLGEKDKMLQPDIYTFNTVLKALANSKEKGSVERAQQILDRIVTNYENGVSKVKPDGITYNTVILAYANSRGKGKGRKAQSLVKQMEAKFQDGDMDVRPTSPTYTTLIKALNWEKDMVRLSEEVVKSLKSDVESDKILDTSIYNALLNVWAKSGYRSSVQRAEEIFAEMKSDYFDNGKTSVKPNARTYTTLIDVHAKSGERGSAKRCLEILNEMEELSMNGDIQSKPNVYTYTAVINSFARSKEVDKAVKAVDVLQRMEEQYR